MTLMKERKQLMEELRQYKQQVTHLEQQLNAYSFKTDPNESLFLVPSRDISALRPVSSSTQLSSSLRSSKSVNCKSDDERRFTMPRSLNSRTIPVDPSTKRNTLSNVPNSIGEYQWKQYSFTLLTARLSNITC